MSLSRTSGIKREAVGFKYSPPMGEAATRPNTHPPPPPPPAARHSSDGSVVPMEIPQPCEATMSPPADVKHEQISPLLHTAGSNKRRSVLIGLFEFALMVRR